MNKGFTLCCLALILTPWLAPAEPLRLSMEEAIAQALDRNYSIRIEKLGPELARQDVRLESGAFDPVLRADYLYSRDEYSGFSEGPVYDEDASYSFGVGSILPWGTQWEAVLEANDRTTPFDPFTGSLEPRDSVSTFAGIVVTQPLLRNFGLDGSYSGVRIAKEGLALSWEEFRAQVMDTVEATVTAYQDLYFAMENLRIAERNRDLALQLLEDNKKRVETGAMAPLDIVQAESEAALREVSVISSRSFLVQAQNALKNLIWDDAQTVLDLELEIVPPEEPDRFQPDLDRDYQIALQQRPEYLASQSGLTIRQYELRRSRRNALPQLDLVGSYGRRGLDRSASDSVDQAFGDGDPSYTIGAVVRIPFPNRTRSAEKARAYILKNRAELTLQQLEQTIRLELDDAATRLTANWDRIQAARTARELAEKSLEAEEKKLRAGTSSTFVVLRLQGDLAVAEIREINALSDYVVSLAQYQRVRGRILDEYGIQLQ